MIDYNGFELNMSLGGNQRCRLCGCCADSFAKSHIIPRAFFKGNDNGTVSEIVSTDGSHVVRRDALYIKDAICHECEHKILAPYDEYATKIYYRGDNAHAISSSDAPNCQILFFEYVDRRLLRGFWASLLWRFSIARLPELEDFSIGAVYEERIRNDLLNNGDFDYIDSLSFRATNQLLQAFILPRQMRFSYNLICGVNGYALGTPFIRSFVSLDQRVHPYAIHASWRLNGYDASASLSKACANKCFIIFSQDTYIDDERLIEKVLYAHRKHRSQWDQERASKVDG